MLLFIDVLSLKVKTLPLSYVETLLGIGISAEVLLWAVVPVNVAISEMMPIKTLFFIVLLLDVSGVQCFLVFYGIIPVLSQGLCEIVASREILFCTHIYIVVSTVV